jgi:hypothetical protein
MHWFIVGIEFVFGVAAGLLLLWGIALFVRWVIMDKLLGI